MSSFPNSLQQSLFLLDPSQGSKELTQSLTKSLNRYRISSQKTHRLQIFQDLGVPGEPQALESTARSARKIILWNKSKPIWVCPLLGAGKLQA